jgi:hypothetical protein
VSSVRIHDSLLKLEAFAEARLKNVTEVVELDNVVGRFPLHFVK